MAARKTTARSRTPRSKAETKTAFDALRHEVESSEGLDRASAEAQKTERTRVMSAVGAITVNTVVQRTTALELDLTRALNGVREQLVAETQQLEDLRAAISIAQEELKTYHNMDVAATALENLISEYKEKEEALEQEISARKAAWEEEQKAHEKAVRERNTLSVQAREREEANYTYDRDLLRKKDADEYKEKLVAQEKSMREQLEKFNKDHAEREAALKAREQDFADLKKKVEAFPADLERQISAEVGKAKALQKKDMEHEFKIKELDLQKQIDLLTQKNQQLENDKTAMASALAQMQNKLDAAEKRVAEVATKAIEGASGQLALQKVQDTIATTSQGGNGGRKS